MTCDCELLNAFLKALREFDGGWLVLRRTGSDPTTIDAGKGRFWDRAEVDARPDVALGGRKHADLVVSVAANGRKTEFVGETLRYLSPGYVPELQERLRKLAVAAHVSSVASEPPRLLVLAGFISEKTREELRGHDISYFDSSGSLYLCGGNFVVERLGREFPPQFQRRGGGTLRMDSPKVSRVVRAVLTGFKGGVRDMATAIRVDPGYVSRLLRSLTAAGFLKRQHGGSVLEVNYTLEGEARGELLEAWASAPRHFWRKRALYRVPEPEPAALEAKLAELCRDAGTRHAFTLWGAANRYGQVTTVPVVALYCDEPWRLPLDALRAKSVGERENLWLLTPRDEGVFQFSQEAGGVTMVHPAQLYYDLMHAPHRGEAAAEMIRRQVLEY